MKLSLALLVIFCSAAWTFAQEQKSAAEKYFSDVELVTQDGQTVRFYYTCDGRQSTYCNPEVDKMQDRALSLAGAEREKAYQEIGKLMYDEVITIPIMHPSFFFGMSKRLEWTPRPDGFTLLKEMKNKE